MNPIVTDQERKDLAKLDKKIASLANHLAPGAKAVPKKKRKLKLRTLEDVIADLRKTFGHDGIEGVYGFMINVKTAKSRMQMRWGNLRSPLASRRA